MIDVSRSTESVPNSKSALDRAQALIDQTEPLLERASERYRASIVLLLGRTLGYNVARIARIAGYDQSFVARAVRRLYDNGISVDEPHAFADVLPAGFWKDVDVALGKVYRQKDDDGRTEWGNPRDWWKHFDYVADGRKSGPVRYVSAVRDEEEWQFEFPESGLDSDQVVVDLDVKWDAREPWLRGETLPPLELTKLAVGDFSLVQAGFSANLAGDSLLFPDAVWME